MTMTEATGSGAARRTNEAAAPYTVPQPPAVVDAAIWPSIAAVPSGLKVAVAGRVAEAIFKAAVRRLPLEVRYPDGTVLGKAATPGHTYPVMTLNRPEAFAARLGDGGLIGLGESFMAGDWDADDLTAVMEVFAARVGSLVPEPLQKLRALYLPRQPRKERNTEQNTRSNISRHYDLSNELFATFLDETMTYSSALFPESGGALKGVAWNGLAAAQQAKIDRLLDKAGVGQGTRVLEIGTGWGELALRAAQRGATRLLRHPLQRAAGTGPQARRRRRLHRRRHHRAQGLPGGRGRVRRRRVRGDDRGRGLRILGHVLPDDRTGPGPRRQGRHPGHHDRPRPAHGHPHQLHLGAQIHLPRRRHSFRPGHRGHHGEADRTARARTPRHGGALRPDAAALGGTLHGPLRRGRRGWASTRSSSGCGCSTSATPARASRPATSTCSRSSSTAGRRASPPRIRRMTAPLAALIEEVLRPLAGGDLPVRLVVWDGSEAGPAGARWSG